MEEMAADVEANYSKDSFERLFWAQQLKAAAQKNCKQMRWHPTVIRWSLYLKSKSTTGYNALRKVIKLPSDRTLRDYTHVYDPRLGFQVDVDKQVCNEFKVDEVAEWQKYVGLVFDEMKVKEGIVYNKNSGEIIGYVNLGEVTNQLLEFERKCASELSDDHYFLPIAKYISCFMVRGIFQHFSICSVCNNWHIFK